MDMQTCIITSWSDLYLLKWIQSGDRSILIDPLLDQYKLYHPQYACDTIHYYIRYLKSQWINQIIVSPWFEYMIQWDNWSFDQVVPLFHHYLTDYILKYTLVGKLWFRWDQADIQMINQRIVSLRADFHPTDRQNQISKFHHDIPIWTVFAWLQKDLIMWWYDKSWILNNILKYDLYHLKDADVDTLIPLQYCYRQLTKQIRHYFNTRKRRFHGLDILQSIMSKFYDMDLPYHVHLYHTVWLDHISYRSSYRRMIAKWWNIQTTLISPFWLSDWW